MRQTDWTLSNAKWGLGDRGNLSDALRIIDALLNTSELNCDEKEENTSTVIDAAMRFQNQAAQYGYKIEWKDSLHGDDEAHANQG